MEKDHAYASSLIRDAAKTVSKEKEVQAILLQLKMSRSIELTTVKTKHLSFYESIYENINWQQLETTSSSKPKVISKKAKPVLLDIKNLKKTYKSTEFELSVDEFQLKQGCITGIIGENAAGKSTFFKIISGNITYQSGSMSFPGFSQIQSNDWRKLKKQISYVSQDIHAWQNGLLDTLRMTASLAGYKGKSNDREVDFIIHRLGLYPHINKQWRQLSGGFKLRFELARALLKKAKILFLDEPLANLDFNSQQVFLNDIKSLAKSSVKPLAVLISSQHIHELEYIIDDTHIMNNGHLSYLGLFSEYRKHIQTNLFEFQLSDNDINVYDIFLL